ncbi:hypothetical protein Q7O60_02565 [Pseudomonas protegens]|uniref:Putative tail fiber protein gp53-like C-terminal domain-containing protein n=1 Tax=Pseudomonas idahonensis TaxID=2942628 RepID=A0ABT5PZ12_9PSED|nr:MULTISPECIES: hypothetical protein [Pseudomonas]MDD1147147.1 hypothetical protein [Pseudomonas idahonensis]MDP9501870.1 hypothetical protein [Pseudomonas protegens]
MDYPKSVPNVGLVNGKFVDENTTTGQVGSLIPASWGNAVTSEILNVLKAASIAPDELSNDQLYKAISKIVAESGVTKEDVSKKADKAITLAGYGITDGATKTDITNLLPRTGGTLSGPVILNNGTDDTPEISWRTPSCAVNLDLTSSVLHINADRGGEKSWPLQLDIAAKAPYFFGNVAWHAGNFNPGLYLPTAALPRCTSGAGWWRCGDTGVMRQWMRIPVGDITNVALRTATWAIQFPNACMSVIATLESAQGALSCQYAVKSRDVAGVVFRFWEWASEVQAADLWLNIEAVGY